MASQQQPRRWFFLGAFGRSTTLQQQQAAAHRAAPTPAPQQPVTRPQIIQIKTSPPQKTTPQAPAPAKSSITTSSPSANVVSAQPPAARLPPVSAAQSRRLAPPAQKSPPKLLFTARPPPPSAPAPNPPATTTLLNNTTTTPPAALQRQIINKPASPSAIPTAVVANQAQTKVSSPKTINEVSKTPPEPTQIKPQTKTENNHQPKIPISMDQRNLETTNKNSNRNELREDTNRKLLDESENSLRRRSTTVVAGYNKGSAMKFNSPDKKGNYTNGWRINNGGNEEEKFNIINNGKSEKSMEMQSSSARKFFINSNVQGINNAIVYNGSSKQEDEGVRLSFSGNPINGGRGIHLRNRIAD